MLFLRIHDEESEHIGEIPQVAPDLFLSNVIHWAVDFDLALASQLLGIIIPDRQGILCRALSFDAYEQVEYDIVDWYRRWLCTRSRGNLGNGHTQQPRSHVMPTGSSVSSRNRLGPGAKNMESSFPFTRDGTLLVVNFNGISSTWLEPTRVQLVLHEELGSPW